MPEAPGQPDPHPDPNPHPTVVYPLSCVGCGYDLFGLPEGGVCPECGVDIGRSISGDHLLGSSKAHRQRLERGARRALAGAWVAWITLGVLAVDVLVGLALPASGVRPWPLIIAQTPLWLGLSATGVLTGLGWCDLLRDDPDRIGDATRGWTMRKLLLGWAFYIVIVATLFQPVFFFVELAEWRRGRGQWPDGLAVADIAVLFGWPVLALSGAMAAEISTLARRLLEGDLAERTRGLALAGWIAFGLLVLPIAWSFLAFLIWGLRGSAPRHWWLLEPICHALAGVFALAWAIQYHTLVRSLRVALLPLASGR